MINDLGCQDHCGALCLPDQGRPYLRGRHLLEERGLPGRRHARRYQVEARPSFFHSLGTDNDMDLRIFFNVYKGIYHGCLWNKQ